MLVWKIVALVLVFLSALLSAGPLARPVWKRLTKSRYFEISILSTIFAVLLILSSLGLKEVTFLAWFTRYAWWKLALEAALLLCSLSFWVAQVHTSERRKGWKEWLSYSGPYAVFFVVMLVGECVRYSGRMYYFAFFYPTGYIMGRLADWLSSLLSRCLRDKRAPFFLSVILLCTATVIQLFVLD